MAKFELLVTVIHKDRKDVAEILQGLSYKVCSTIFTKRFEFG